MIADMVVSKTQRRSPPSAMRTERIVARASNDTWERM